MNVDNAMEAAKAYRHNEQDGDALYEAEEVAITLAAEVERLRGELKLRDDYDKRVPDPRNHKFFDQTCGEHGCKSRQVDRLKAELAAVKADVKN